MTNQTQLSTFNFEESSIRVVSINNEPWFIAKDVCEAIGIDNNRKALLALDDDEKGVTLSNTLGGMQEMNIISESGMYTLILRCRDAVKKGSIPHRFRKWVTAEVLPQIRKTGKYEKVSTTVDDRTGLRDAVNMLVSKKGLLYSDAYQLVHHRFNVKSIEELSKEQLPQAVEYVHRVILEGELIDPSVLQLSKNSQHLETTLKIMVELYGYCLHAYEMQEKLSQYPALIEEINTKIGGQYLHNLKHPLEQVMTKAKHFIRSNSEKLTLIKAVDHLLN
ncbi:antirepressor [Gallibacterium salpingitidis]|uniref:Antirepressor n=1 Tax=Gallibacterium salpingitidis TaxID=505341 RepID=A0AB36E0C9_9PAST|nr:Bro-N domain-containing protein [Gallibacterium salpingitidis]OBX07846.1 antirepressor [Gallibacterium salpingitidis]OBX09609.1 antirepressor [Gallibacterium salpingitidis]